MAASFPAAQKSFVQQTDDVSDADAADVNAIYDEVEAIESHLGAGSIAVGQILLTGTAPWFRLYNTTEEDTDGGRESQLQWRGEQSGGEISTLGLIEISHDGASDDEKGKFFLKLNDGDDANSPSTVMTANSIGAFTITTTPTGASAVHGLNVTMTDATATTGGDGSGLHLGIKYTGDHTGSGWKTALAIDYEIEGNNSYCFAESIWMGDGANATIGSLSGLYIYMDDKNAAATISNKFALDLNIDDTTSATLSGFMRVYSHGTGAVGSVIYLGNSGANKITNFLDFAAGVAPFSAGAPADMTADGKIACDIGGSTYYIAMYAA